MHHDPRPSQIVTDQWQFLHFAEEKRWTHVGVNHVVGEEEVAPGCHIGPLHIRATPEVSSRVL